MSSAKNETATKHDLEKQKVQQQQQQQQQESASENEESGSVTDQSSSLSENAARKHKNQHHHHHYHYHGNATSTPAQQFSVQRSDTDGLRMRISAIRPTVILNTKTHHNNNKTLDNTKIIDKNKLSNKQQRRLSQSQTQSPHTHTHTHKPQAKDQLITTPTIVATSATSSTTAPATAKMSDSSRNLDTDSNTTTTSGKSILIATKQLEQLPALTLATTVPATYLSDATESGLSEATTTTIAAGSNKLTAKRIKVKRKKIATKCNTNSNAIAHANAADDKKLNMKKARLQTEFSSDSEDDLPLKKLHQQRAPRLLLTAINMPVSALSVTQTHVGSDNIGLSSSDNELPNLVKAAIKCVESDTEDTTNEGSFRKAAKSKNVPQYQSTLLQDFMEKTQMLGQKTVSGSGIHLHNANASPDRLSLKAVASSQSDSIASSTSRKRRGRPKKSSALANSNANGALAINESADSGVISTTSTTQSTTPSPKMPTTTTATATTSSASRRQQPQQPATDNVSTESHLTANTLTATAVKPKIDIAYLDKRMYATERVLYPPPRNKRRQSTSAASTAATTRQKKTNSSKEDGQLDPVWREIDVNKKFRLRSVSGYKSDGGNATICSKILAAKSGYVSDYGGVHHHRSHHSHNSGYKSDASCKSRYSTKSCMSRRSRAKSCGYRSDCKESGSGHKSSKFRRKRRASMLFKSNAKSVSNLNFEQDILQLAGLSLGQSSEESNEYVCKPSLKSLPTTSASKKYGEINRYVTTGQYFGSGNLDTGAAGASNYNALNDTNQEGFVGKMILQRKISLPSELTQSSAARKIKSRRSSAASYCSSYYSGTSRVRRRHRRKSICMSRGSSKVVNIDSKLLTEIEIITSTFAARCRIQDDRLTAGSSVKEKLLAEANKLQQSLAAVAGLTAGIGSSSTALGSTKSRDKRGQKKRKMSEPLVDFAMLSASAAAGGGHTPNTSAASGKRRHKKTSTSSSPDDHKLPLKKRHYLLTPGEKSSEAAVFAAAAKLNAEAWAAAAAAAKTTASTKSQAQFNAARASQSTNAGKSGLTPKKRHLMQNVSEDSGSSSSPLRVNVETNSISGGKLLDISPSSLCSLKQQKRNRLEIKSAVAGAEKLKAAGMLGAAVDSPSSCPPPGVFEPSVELEIQIPPIAKLSDTTSIITKAEVDSPLLALDINASTATKLEQGTRVVEALLHKTGGNLLLKRKRKKINRTGFPTVKRKKRKTSDLLPPATSAAELATENEEQLVAQTKTPITIGVADSKAVASETPPVCDRVPQVGEASESFVARANQRAPRLSVVALERLQGSPRPTTPAKASKTAVGVKQMAGRRTRNEKFSKNGKHEATTGKTSKAKRTESAAEPPKMRGRRPKAIENNEKTPKHNNEPEVEIQPNSSGTPKKGRRRKHANGVNDEINTQADTTHIKPVNSAQIKLPAGVDTNTNFSCKVRLKRRSTLHALTIAKPTPLPTTENAKETLSTPEAIDAEAAAKDVDLLVLEHDILPLSEAQSLESAEYTTYTSDTSDDKYSNASLTVRKPSRIKKNYITAGLFSDFFKQLEMPPPPRAPKKSVDKLQPASPANNTETEILGSLLPPPPYCEQHFRRTVVDFELPYDIWWAYKHAKLPQRHSVPSWNYKKIRTNVYAESVRPNMAGFEHPTCNCKPDAACGDNCLNRMVYTECSPTNCPAGDKCRNQKIQRHEVAPVERFMTENKGWGVRTKQPIQKGTYILEYVGEVVTEREFKQRMGTIYLNDTHHYCLHLDGGLVIDGQRMGSDCRFVNHSCEPNCEMQKWSVNGLSRMVLFAKRKINEGEELTYDYNFSLFNPSEGQPCRCNTPQCRGVIGGKSQRVKPLPAEVKPNETTPKDVQNGRQRKRKARKNTQQRQQTKEVAVACVQQLSEKEKKLVKQFNIFLLRNFEKIRRCKAKHQSRRSTLNGNSASPTPSAGGTEATASGALSTRRPSTPSTTLAAQINALCSARNIKTRGLTLAGQDPEVEKMAKMAVILRDICAALESLKDDKDDAQMTLVSLVLCGVPGGNKKRKAIKTVSQKQAPSELKTVQSNIEQGHYKLPSEFDEDMQLLFAESRQLHADDAAKLAALETLSAAYNEQKKASYEQLLEIIGDAQSLTSFKDIDAPAVETPITDEKDTTTTAAETAVNTDITQSQTESTQSPTVEVSANATIVPDNAMQSNEDVIRCICGLYKDEGLMIQCSNCMVWQHTECTKADINAENYQCERCEPREVDREIPLEEFTEEGHRYYLSLMRGQLQVRQGDAVYVLRDIPIKDEQDKKHTYETIGNIDYQECDIFRVEHLWKNDEGKRYIFGHHFLRPHETFHEPSRRFYPNEVVRVSLYEVVPIELVIGRCWVLDRTTFCKGRPIECIDEDHCYICELRVDKTARFFSKAKANYPTCTKSYAFRKFPEKLKISKTYAPHDVDPSMLKTKKQKAENDAAYANAANSVVNNNNQEQYKATTSAAAGRKRQDSNSPATVQKISTTVAAVVPTVKTLKQKRKRLENVLNTMKLKCLDAHTAQESPIDLSYLLTGRGARQRKTNNSAATNPTAI